MGTAQQTILVVEDEVLIRMTAVATLKDAGFQILEAGNSAQALDMLSRHGEVSILLTDVRMPGPMDGLDLVAQVHHDHPAIRSIVMSAHATAMQASDAGAVGFLRKPYMEQAMLQAVYDTIKRHLVDPAPQHAFR
ncbi:MAG: hypothetical protein RL274_1614 [Pseudomonadota bacterium]|jgi:DNA-binding NtrC family response regulator